jgi:hypothetical protein
MILMFEMFCWSARYCPECKVDTSEVVLAGQKLKDSKKKAKMASAQSNTSRDWGKVSFCFCSNLIHASSSMLIVVG